MGFHSDGRSSSRAGQFLDDVNADDILFGNVFENPIRDHLPWGTSIAVKFM